MHDHRFWKNTRRKSRLALRSIHSLGTQHKERHFSLVGHWECISVNQRCWMRTSHLMNKFLGVPCSTLIGAYILSILQFWLHQIIFRVRHPCNERHKYQVPYYAIQQSGYVPPIFGNFVGAIPPPNASASNDDLRIQLALRK